MRANNYYTKNFNRWLITALFFYCFSFSLKAIELSSSQKGHELSLRVTDINYPTELLNKEVNSGLQSRFFSIITFEKAGDIFTQCSYSLSVTYDLWDEHYRIEQIENTGLASSFIMTDVNEVYNKLENLEIKCQLKGIQPDSNLIIKAQVFVNPVEHKRIEKIKSWINSSQGHNSDSGSTSSNTNVGNNHNSLINVGGNTVKSIMKDTGATARPRFEKLFDKILSQYSGPSEVISLWKSTVASKTLNLRQANNEK
jgi:hypothetical protein